MALAFIVGLVAYQQVVGIRGYLIGSFREGCNIDFAFHLLDGNLEDYVAESVPQNRFHFNIMMMGLSTD